MQKKKWCGAREGVDLMHIMDALISRYIKTHKLKLYFYMARKHTFSKPMWINKLFMTVSGISDISKASCRIRSKCKYKTLIIVMSN